MTVDTAARTTLRVVHEKGKRRYGAFFGRNSTFFFSNWGRLWSLLGQNFRSLSDKSRSSQKSTPLEADANFTRLKTPSRAVPPNPFVSPSALNNLRSGHSGIDGFHQGTLSAPRN